MIENFVLGEFDFVQFQRCCDRCGFDLRYFGPEISGSEQEIVKHRFDSLNVIKLKRFQFVCKGTPYDVAECQEREWTTALPGLKAEFFKWKGASGSQGVAKYQNNTLDDVSKQLIDQSKAVTVAGLLLLIPKQITNDVSPNKASVWYWMTGSLVMLVILYLMSRTIRFRRPKARWIFLVVAFVLFWPLYLLYRVICHPGSPHHMVLPACSSIRTRNGKAASSMKARKSSQSLCKMGRPDFMATVYLFTVGQYPHEFGESAQFWND